VRDLVAARRDLPTREPAEDIPWSRPTQFAYSRRPLRI